MMQQLPPRSDAGPDQDDPGGASVVEEPMPGQLSMLDLIDQCANALGVWGPEDNIRVNPPRRRST